MKMICDVPDEAYKAVKCGTWCGSYVAEKMIANGTPIPDNATVCDIEQIKADIEAARYGLINDGLDVALRIIDKYTKGD